MKNIFYIFGSLSAFLGVALGAFGAHSLKESLSPEMLSIFETGVRYQMYHSFALFIAGWAFQKYSHVSFSKAGWLFVSGIVLFSGSLYMLAATGTSMFGAVTPVGGLAFLAGWLFLAVGFWKTKSRELSIGLAV
ncbi:MAG TPA: DUF423 domain-containing protein [Bacteroidota bacterium]